MTGVTAPPITSQVLTTRSSPSVRTGSRGTPPVATITTSGVQGDDVGDIGNRVVAHSTPSRRHSRHEPVDDADEIRDAGGCARREADLPARSDGRLEQR